MGADKGFDMVPALTNTEGDNKLWEIFLADIKLKYAEDPLFKFQPNFMEFTVGEHPRLPYEGHKFRRFSAKITGSHAGSVERYLDGVTEIAHEHFGSRVQRWNELSDVLGFYGWREVYDAEKS